MTLFSFPRSRVVMHRVDSRYTKLPDNTNKTRLLRLDDFVIASAQELTSVCIPTQERGNEECASCYSMSLTPGSFVVVNQNWWMRYAYAISLVILFPRSCVVTHRLIRGIPSCLTIPTKQDIETR